MKYFVFVLLATYVIASDPKANGCNKSKQSATPSCIQEKIDQIKAQPKWNPPAEVNEYLFNDQHVFLFSSPCCDQYNILYDANCNTLCAPSGGYTGKGDNKCPDFRDKAKHVRIVWKDER